MERSDPLICPDRRQETQASTSYDDGWWVGLSIEWITRCILCIRAISWFYPRSWWYHRSRCSETKPTDAAYCDAKQSLWSHYRRSSAFRSCTSDHRWRCPLCPQSRVHHRQRSQIISQDRTTQAYDPDDAICRSRPIQTISFWLSPTLGGESRLYHHA